MVDITITGSSEWLQLYEQSLHGQGLSNSSFGFSDATIVATSSYSSSTSMDSLSNTNTSPPSIISGVVASPNNNINRRSCFSKPLRRRPSRASKKSPTTTHLNANVHNFRALVQKFTGCPKRSSSKLGPINLNFKLGRIQNRGGSSKLISPFGHDYQYNHQHHSQVGWPGQGRCREENYCMASSLEDHDDQKVINRPDHHAYNSPVFGGDPVTMPGNLKVPDDGFFWDDFDLHHDFPMVEESFFSSIDIVNGCFA